MVTDMPQPATSQQERIAQAILTRIGSGIDDLALFTEGNECPVITNDTRAWWVDRDGSVEVMILTSGTYSDGLYAVDAGDEVVSAHITAAGLVSNLAGPSNDRAVPAPLAAVQTLTEALTLARDVLAEVQA